jgi:small subunit ribosomal protein S19e
MTSVYDVPADKLIMSAAEDLKTKVKAPEFAKIIKTGVSKERAPENEDWWYIRMAATLRKYYTKQTLGVNILRGYFGGRQRRGAKPAIFAKASGKVTRLIVQQLEKEGFLVKTEKGRKITPKGRLYLDKFAKQVTQEKK